MRDHEPEHFFLGPNSAHPARPEVWTLRRPPDNAIDRWDGATYRRALALPSGPAEVAVAQMGPPDTPRLRVTVQGDLRGSETKHAVTPALERLLGLRAELAPFYRLASRDSQLRPLMRRYLGAKPPRFTSVFEGVVNAISSQRVSRILGIRLLNRLTARFGAALRD